MTIWLNVDTLPKAEIGISTCDQPSPRSVTVTPAGGDARSIVTGTEAPGNGSSSFTTTVLSLRPLTLNRSVSYAAAKPGVKPTMPNWPSEPPP